MVNGIKLVLASTLIFPSICLTAAGEWRITTVDFGVNQRGAPPDVGCGTSLALDSGGKPHISYYDRGNRSLKYARWSGTNWRITTVDVADWGGAFNSLAVDSRDRPHIAYYDFDNGDLKYAHWTGSSWRITVADSEGNVGEDCAIALDSADRPHISYQDVGHGDLKYARWDGNRWDVQFVDRDRWVASGTSIAVDSLGRAHIAYRSRFPEEGLKYARWTGTRWEITFAVKKGGMGRMPSIALDSSNKPHISHLDYYGDNLEYAKWTGTKWENTTVDSKGMMGRYSSIALDAHDRPHISYNGYVPGFDLKYARGYGEGWLIATADSRGQVGEYTSIALDADGDPHVSYYDMTNHALKYACRISGVGIRLNSFSAKTRGDGVNILWETAVEKNLAGFNLYREGDAGRGLGRVKLNAKLITGRSPYAFVDEDVVAGEGYKYWLEAVALSGERATFGPAAVRLPTKTAAFALYQNAPNPTRGQTTFAFSLPAAGRAELKIYDLAGREVWAHEGTFAEGKNELAATFELAPGVYVYRLEAGAEASAKRMVVVK
jgi:hypothetical protein